jgi:hypothetical protein
MAIGTHIWVADVAWIVPGATPNPANFKKYLTVASDLTAVQKEQTIRAVMAFDFGNMDNAPNSVVITNVQQFSP